MSSTAQMIKSMFRGELEVSNKVSDKTIALPAKIYAGFGQIAAKLRTFLIPGKSKEATLRDLLEKFRTSSSPAIKAAYETLIRDVGPVLEKREGIEKAADLVRQKTEEDREKTYKSFKSVARAKDPLSQENKNEVDKAEKTWASANTELKKLEEKLNQNDLQIAACLATTQRITELLPDHAKSALSQVQAATQRH